MFYITLFFFLGGGGFGCFFPGCCFVCFFMFAISCCYGFVRKRSYLKDFALDIYRC